MEVTELMGPWKLLTKEINPLKVVKYIFQTWDMEFLKASIKKKSRLRMKSTISYKLKGLEV